ncbi:type II toxin-antitoxin system VapC family toxin [Enorma sp.]|uniref:type II toxin-antitoxin system VapC family toxin n=1 Tax=Enorma sp. TaxID=1920692 RepID=UPI003AB56C5F
MTKSPREGARLPIKILVDTNIWLDYFLARSGHHHAVSTFIAKAYEREDIVLYVPSLSLKDLAYQLASLMKLDARRAGKDVTPDIAAAACEVSWGCVRNVLEKALVAPIGHTEVLGAFTYKRIHDDFEDDLVLAALGAVDANFLMTHDAALRRHVGDFCITVEEGLELLAELDE